MTRSERMQENCESVICCYVRTDGLYIDMGTIARDTGLSIYTVRRVIDELQSQNILNDQKHVFEPYISLYYSEILEAKVTEDKEEKRRIAAKDFFHWACKYAYMYEYSVVSKAVYYDDQIYPKKDWDNWPEMIKRDFVNRGFEGLLRNGDFNKRISVDSGRIFLDHKSIGDYCDKGKYDVIGKIFLEVRDADLVEVNH